jgi:hypothetical protein
MSVFSGGGWCGWPNGAGNRTSYLSWVENAWYSGEEEGSQYNKKKCPSKPVGIEPYLPTYSPSIKQLNNLGDSSFSSAYNELETGKGCKSLVTCSTDPDIKYCATGCRDELTFRNSLQNKSLRIRNLTNKVINHVPFYQGIIPIPGKELLAATGEIGGGWGASLRPPNRVKFTGQIEYKRLSPILGGLPADAEIKTISVTTQSHEITGTLEHYTLGERVRSKTGTYSFRPKGGVYSAMRIKTNKNKSGTKTTYSVTEATIDSNNANYTIVGTVCVQWGLYGELRTCYPIYKSNELIIEKSIGSEKTMVIAFEAWTDSVAYGSKKWAGWNGSQRRNSRTRYKYTLG